MGGRCRGRGLRGKPEWKVGCRPAARQSRRSRDRHLEDRLLSARVGYALANWLFYARAGAAWAGNKYSITGTFAGTPFGFEGVDNRFGWTAGAGVEWAFAQVWSARLEYDYLALGHRSALMSDAINGFSGGMSVNQSAQMVKLGINFHMWAVP
jgi:outer membrane immunogenic protein